ncbi:MAG: hypothetical protein A2W23_06715 [Planctomycetes bacterium RBG_16_43_13]|nr:MAG: hypothetical protein A2W23_06715 [Planctomycetes bacterium RBG_16_43_13]
MKSVLAKRKKVSGGRKIISKIEVFIDGASRGNPGLSSAAVVIKQGNEVILEQGYFLSNTTNNVAEYTALIKALELLDVLVNDSHSSIRLNAIKPIKWSNVAIRINSDSELLVKQMSGEYRVKDSNLKLLFEKARRYMRLFKKMELRHIPREQNKEADNLANRVLNLQEDIA